MSTSPDAFWISTEDWHTAGEPFRIVSTLPSHCLTTGSSVAERRLNIVNTPNHPLDTLRRSLCHEPRGHADMYGGFIVPPNDDGAAFGVAFWHKDGFSTACGHGTIALGLWAVEHGLVTRKEEGTTRVVIDVPSGRVVAEVQSKGGKVVSVDFINVDSYQIASDLPVNMSNGSHVKVDIAWGGATYAYVPANLFNLSVEPRNHDAFISLGREIKAGLGDRGRHNDLDLYGVCFYDDLSPGADRNTVTMRNVVVFADGQIDRSPCGSGTAARVAILYAQGRVDEDKQLIHRSIINTEFRASVLERKEGSPTKFPACVPRISGMAYLTGRHEFWIDPNDPTYPGFLFR